MSIMCIVLKESDKTENIEEVHRNKMIIAISFQLLRGNSIFPRLSSSGLPEGRYSLFLFYKSKDRNQ